ncbi:MAG: hypothetical protein ACE5I1_29645 [bacterium]
MATRIGALSAILAAGQASNSTFAPLRFQQKKGKNLVAHQAQKNCRRKQRYSRECIS